MRLLVAGLGGIGQRHVRNLRALLGADAEIDAFRVRGETTTLSDRLTVVPGENVVERYDIRVFHDLNEALDQGPDAVLVCNPSSLHVPVATEAARRGSAVFVEKPLSNSEDGVRELIELVDQRKLVGLVGYQMRFHPVLLRAEGMLTAGSLGQITSVRIQVGEYLPAWHGYEDYRRMYAARSELGGGVILSQIHELDYAYWFFGLPARVFALGGHLSKLAVDVEDTASILMECDVDGVRVPVHVQMDFVQRPPSRSCEIVGDSGRMIINLVDPSLSVFDSEGEIVERFAPEGFQRNDLFLDEMRHFLACLAGREKPRVSLRDASHSLRMALAAKRSIESGAVIELSRSLA